MNIQLNDVSDSETKSRDGVCTPSRVNQIRIVTYVKRRCLPDKVFLALKAQFLNHLLFPLGPPIIPVLHYFLKKIFIFYGTSMGQNI